MKFSNSHARFGGLLLLLAFSACAVDDRPMTFSFRALDAAGASETGGAAGANPTGGGHSGAASGAQNGAGDAAAGENAVGEGEGGTSPSGGIPSSAGSATNNEGGAMSGGGTTAGGSGGAATGGSAGSGAATGGAATGGIAGSGVAGTAGNPFPCGDLNLDGVDDCSQTLVQNSRFDSSLSGWEGEASLTQAWNATNATSKPGSGSLMLKNTAAVVQAVGSTAIGSHQCIPATPDTSYDLALRVSLPSGQTGGAGGINLWLFDDDACQGNLVPPHPAPNAALISGGIAGQWTVLSGQLWVPGGVHSMYVRLVAIKPFTQPELSVLVDDVLIVEH